MSSESASTNPHSRLGLQIQRGRTQFPQRPISTPKFLIGSGSDCHLRLGGAEMPSLHSILLVSDDGNYLERTAEAPPLIVNGHEQVSVWLQVGDRIEIGSIEMEVVELKSELESAAAEVSAGDTDAARDSELSKYTPLELVELISQDLEILENFKSRQIMGAEALLDRLIEIEPALAGDGIELERQASIPDPEVILKSFKEMDDQSILNGLDQIVEELNQFGLDLQKRSIRLAQQEATYAEAAQTLMAVQERMSQQLESLMAYLAQLPEDRDDEARKVA